MISFYMVFNAQLCSLTLGAAPSDIYNFSDCKFDEIAINVPGDSINGPYPCMDISLGNAKKFANFLNNLIEKMESKPVGDIKEGNVNMEQKNE